MKNTFKFNPELIEFCKEELNYLLDNLSYIPLKKDQYDKNHAKKIYVLEATSEKSLEISKRYKKNQSNGKENRKATQLCFYGDNDYIKKIASKISLFKSKQENSSFKFRLSGFFLYPENSYMNWHTNYNDPGLRIYVTHVPESDKSFFRYQNPDNGEIITTWDKKGWQAREFIVGDTDETDLWHCVGSYTDRLSIGFKIDKID